VYVRDHVLTFPLVEAAYILYVVVIFAEPSTCFFVRTVLYALVTSSVAQGSQFCIGSISTLCCSI
jgi:hypothetical protein